MAWYQKLPIPGSQASRIRASASRKTTGQRLRHKLRTREPKHAFYKAYSSSVSINGYTVKTTTRYQLAKLFNVGIPTITKWEKAGVLPEPFMYMARGQSKYPVYLASQTYCLIRVVNDLIKDGGYVSIPWAYLTDHIEMLYVGYKEALNNYHRRAGYFDEDKEDHGDKFGVTFID